MCILHIHAHAIIHHYLGSNANHQSSVQYNFADEAYDVYRKAHDKLVDLKAATTNEDLQGIYAKSTGYVARLAMIGLCTGTGYSGCGYYQHSNLDSSH